LSDITVDGGIEREREREKGGEGRRDGSRTRGRRRSFELSRTGIFLVFGGKAGPDFCLLFDLGRWIGE